MNRARLFSIATALALATLSPVGVAAPIEWRLFTHFGPNDVPTKLNQAFAADVEQATGGRLKISVHAGGDLPFNPNDSLRILRTGQVEMSQVAIGTVAGDLPQINVFSMPFVCSNVDAFYDKALPAVRPAIDQAIQAKFRARPLLHFSMPPQQIWVNKPVAAMEDLKGLKIRTWNREQIELMRLLGGSGVAIPVTEVIPSLQRSVVDGAITAVIPALAWRIQDVVKNGYLLNLSLSHELIAVSQAALDALPADLREILLARSAQWAAKYRTGIAEADSKAAQTLTDGGMTLRKASAADMARLQKMTTPMVEAWAQKYGEASQAMLAEVRKACD